jgi:hypothetical protein
VQCLQQGADGAGGGGGSSKPCYQVLEEAGGCRNLVKGVLEPCSSGLLS